MNNEKRQYLIASRSELLSNLNQLRNELEVAILNEESPEFIGLLRSSIKTCQNKLSNINFDIGVYNIANNKKHQVALQKAYREKVKEVLGLNEYYEFNKKLTRDLAESLPFIPTKSWNKQ
jgi:hypothetical protein